MGRERQAQRIEAARGSTALGLDHLIVRGHPDAPVLLLLHSTGGSERELLGLGRVLDPGATLLSPCGDVVEDDGTRRFFRRSAPRDPDLADLATRTDNLAAFVRSAVRAYGLEGRPAIAVGYSNGANIAASLLLTGADVIGAAVLLRATHIHDAAPGVDLSGHDVLMRSGREDPYLPTDGPARLARALRVCGARVTHDEVAAGHELADNESAEVGSWLAQRVAASA